MDEPLGLVNGPHDDPAKCPTYYDGCNCTVETLRHNMNCLTLIEKERDNLKLRAHELQKLARRIISDRACICNVPSHRCGTNQMLEDLGDIIRGTEKRACDCGCHGPLSMTAKYPCKSCGCEKA